MGQPPPQVLELVELDHLIYDLYGLSEEEIRIVEDTTTSQAEP